jgi:hypothetical protein
MKKWMWAVLVLIIVLLAYAVFIFFNFTRERPTVAEVIMKSGIVKKTRPVRKVRLKSEKAKMMTKKPTSKEPNTAFPSSYCVDQVIDETTGIMHQKIDEDCSGNFDTCIEIQLNDYGEGIKQKIFNDCGSMPSNCTKYTHNEFGEIVAYYEDVDCDGRIDNCTITKRNEHGDDTEVFIDKNCDGVLGEKESRMCFAYEYDENDLMIRWEWSRCGGPKSLCKEYDYDFAAGIRHEETDYRCDGSVDSCSVEFYSDEGETIANFTDSGCDGAWNSCSYSGFVSTIGGEDCTKKYDELKTGRGIE